MKTQRITRSLLAVTAVATLALSACTSGDGSDDNSGDGGNGAPSADLSSVPEAPFAPDASAAQDATGEAAVSGNVDTFIATATAAGWECIPGADPYTGKPGATCNPGAQDVLTKAVFAIFDRADVADGAEAARLARETLTGEVGGDAPTAPDAEGAESAEGAEDDVFADQYLPLDSDTLAGYCVNTLGTCGGSDFEGLGLTLG